MPATQDRIHIRIWWAGRCARPSAFLFARGNSHSASRGVSGKRPVTQACWERIVSTSAVSASGSRLPIRAALWLS